MRKHQTAMSIYNEGGIKMKLKQALKQFIGEKSAKLQINKNVYLIRYVGKNFVGIEADTLTVNVEYNGYSTISTRIEARTADGVMAEVKKAVVNYLQWMQEKELKALNQYTWEKQYQGIENL